MTLRTPLCDQLGIDAPILLAGMGGVAYAGVCAAVSEAGGFGTLGMASEGPDGIRREMRRVRELTQKPFGVDLLAALPESMMQAIDVIIAEGAKGSRPPMTLPHPRLQERAFVLLPMRDVAAGWRHPVSGASLEELIRALDKGGGAEAMADAGGAFGTEWHASFPGGGRGNA